LQESARSACSLLQATYYVLFTRTSGSFWEHFDPLMMN